MNPSPSSALLDANSMAEELFNSFVDQFEERKLTTEQIAARSSVQRSFWKLDYILKLMDNSHKNAVENMHKHLSDPYSGLDLDPIGQTEVHAESFYCEAHRLKDVLENKWKLPTKKKFRSLRFLRNHVVEHTCVDRSVSSWGIESGPKLFVGAETLKNKKAMGLDRGFFSNAKDFYSELTTILEKASGNSKVRV